MSSKTGNEVPDPRVSEVYRGHATECAPDRLNKSILTLAAREAHGKRGFASLLDSWTRPLTVAATVVLSFTLVLELTREPPIPVPALTAPESLQEQFQPKDTHTIDNARNQARLRAGSNQTGDVQLKKNPVPATGSGLTLPPDSASSKDFGERRGCDDSVRETAAGWLACIEALRESGEEQLADWESEQFMLQFPDV